MGWVKNFIDGAMKLQGNVLPDYSENKRKAGYGRSARLIIDGEEGGVFDLWFCEEGVRPKPEGVVIKNTVYMKEDTLLNLITPDIDLDILVETIDKEGGLEKALSKMLPRLDFKTAYANDLIIVSGENSDVDSEEWARILENVLMKIAFPIVVKGLLRRKAKVR